MKELKGTSESTSVSDTPFASSSNIALAIQDRKIFIGPKIPIGIANPRIIFYCINTASGVYEFLSLYRYLRMRWRS